MIRLYQASDTDDLIAIWRAASALAHPFLSSSFIDSEADNMRNIYLLHAQTWVAEDAGRPVGFIAMIESQIGGLFLDPSLHGQGKGRAMVDHVRSQLDPLSVEVFTRNAIGRAFYDRYGFAENARYVHEATGEEVITMSLPA